jgi:hypothetical protein
MSGGRHHSYASLEVYPVYHYPGMVRDDDLQLNDGNDQFNPDAFYRFLIARSADATVQPPRRLSRIAERYFRLKFGVAPEQVPDCLSLLWRILVLDHLKGTTPRPSRARRSFIKTIKYTYERFTARGYARYRTAARTPLSRYVMRRNVNRLPPDQRGEDTEDDRT